SGITYRKSPEAVRPRVFPSFYSRFSAGGDLLSHTLPSAVPSAQADLASGFEKGPGVTPPQKPPTQPTEQQPPQHTPPHKSSSESAVTAIEPDTKQWTRTPKYPSHSSNMKMLYFIGKLVPVTSQRLTTLPDPAYQPRHLQGTSNETS